MSENRGATPRSGARCLLAHVMVPTNLLAALCAFETWAGESREPARLTVVLCNPHATDEVVRSMAEVMRRMLSGFPEVEGFVVLLADEYRHLVDLPGPLRVDEMRRVLGLRSIAAWSFAHDLSGDVVTLLGQAFPAATAICTGDGLGHVSELDYRLTMMGLPPSPPLPPPARPGPMGRLLRRLTGRPEPRRRVLGGSLLADRAILVLPAYETRDFRDLIPLAVCPRPVVVDTVGRAERGCQELTRYAADLAGRLGPDRAVILTETWTEAGFMPLEREIAFWADLVRAMVAPSTRLLLKGHPNETAPRFAALRDALGPAYDVTEVDPGFRRYPIELWTPLLSEGRIITTGYPEVSLKYLYGSDVLQPLDGDLIRDLFVANAAPIVADAIAMQTAMMRRLPGWDGRSPLYDGASVARASPVS